LAKRRGKENPSALTPITIAQILRWADQWHARYGQWPTQTSGAIPRSAGLNWSQVDDALRLGLRGLRGGSSLPRLLLARRRVRKRLELPSLSETQILAWADKHRRRTSAWPTTRSGLIPGTRGTTWRQISQALRRGDRGLPGGTSLREFLEDHRGVSAKTSPLSEEKILAWADTHRRRTGAWPNRRSGPVREARGENWSSIYTALTRGLRGLPGGKTFPQLLVEKRKATLAIRPQRGPLRIPQIVRWADAYRKRTGRWPSQQSGPVLEAPGETWAGIDESLRGGHRGLPGGSSLPRLLAHARGKEHPLDLRRLTVKQILTWADTWHTRTSKWPISTSGAIRGAEGLTWRLVDLALRDGRRGLPGGSSLSRLLAERRGASRRRD
jgi:hypothetical protein